MFRHCRGYLSIQRHRRAQVPPQPAAEHDAGNDEDQGREDEADTEAIVNEAQNQQNVENPRVREKIFLILDRLKSMKTIHT